MTYLEAVNLTTSTAKALQIWALLRELLKLEPHEEALVILKFDPMAQTTHTSKGQ